MKPCTIAFVILSVLVFMSGCSQTGTENAGNVPAGTATPVAKATATPDEFAAARAIYAKHCSVCHGDKGEGGIVKVEDKKLKVPSLKEGHALHHPDADFVKQITNGGGGMPKFKDKLSPEEITAMVRFIRHEFQGK
jgi:mono/diheme cytochrome c family protein